MKPEVHKLRVNVKSLAAEASFIREEIKRARTTEAKNALAVHRMTRVKPEARLANLALAFVKGVPYEVVEANAKKEPSPVELHRKVLRFTWIPNIEQKVHDWLRT
jgi:hypothetical protein